jgi:hypothetical protein
MAILEFADPIPVKTPVGNGYALFVESTQHDHYWTCVLDNGAVLTVTQDRIRVARCYERRRGLGDSEMRAIVEAACQPAKSSRPSSLRRAKKRRS